MKHINILKKSAPLVLTITLGLGALTAYANNGFTEIPFTDGDASTTGLFGQEGTSVFKKITGIVTMIETTEDGRTFIRLENSEGGETDFFIEDNTVLIDNQGLATFDAIQEGEYTTAYYVEPLMMTMIYPAQYSLSVLELQGENEYSNADVSLYDENLLNAEKDLYIHPSDETVILDQRGEEYEGSLENQALIVLYDIMALSYPAQTVPRMIFVLDAIPQLPEAPEAQLPMDKLNPEDFEQMIIFVNGEYLDTAHVHVPENGEILFPLRPIAEAMGFDVKWDSQLGKIVIGVAITITPGSTEYFIGRMAPLHMSIAPVIIDGITYVPGDFINLALEGQIDISQGIYNITTTNNLTE